MLTDAKEYIKGFVRARSGDLFVACMIFLVSIGSFGLGRLSVRITQHATVRITGKGAEVSTAAVMRGDAVKRVSELPEASAGAVVASKNGTAYHLPWCSGAQKIKEENKVWFASKADAEARGYRPAANCDGL
ncbi:MAG: hypothetical protein A3I44_01255 [Candidatus Sungbacteria bacterium RIFCSPLOWO2_02_FULL_51_17]|uniref:Ada DNA repair metal-binding domain-containing protein n=1 Tax=Candidatus Sungbacteria bacterium RIFCSPHIGHO2_02_FULL_51_29 TaxID=1802273 RepID=A0A1G2KUS6_9BACT|nr:MAG: hypothetical protein A2676_00960 [Candidatus Sungbacteria bacterium RIFCSPHIGHO2_01_FULL_51_22]OHA02201.1 MAG: hypothetical protein A3C16_00755 [Candidatus Sungbacteria bacterium RIFCSPHIGHO2_02_FULL_51_29]OHA07640.1 MAG: hypothetical protein A3B29_05580 [Candidatus Sungbacteria bacterium RIFCSPLOWO2_01_FULL_51_34]OHA10747.1 MAG: hypothetical protein A3I44_01255 [Candidatus Sungbacteria bacterium RIFCSPLOWO2_02_FULL_51_17]